MPKSDEVSEFRKLVGIDPTLPGLSMQEGISAQQASSIVYEALDAYITKHGAVALKDASVNREGKDVVLYVGESKWKIKIEKKGGKDKPEDEDEEEEEE